MHIMDFIHSCLKWVTMGLIMDGAIYQIKSFVHETPMEELTRSIDQSKLESPHQEYVTGWWINHRHHNS